MRISLISIRALFPKGCQVKFKEDQVKNFTNDAGIECSYRFRMSKQAIYTWKPFTIDIIFQPNDDCNFEDQNGGSVFRVQAYSIYELSSKTSSYLGDGKYRLLQRIKVRGLAPCSG